MTLSIDTSIFQDLWNSILNGNTDNIEFLYEKLEMVNELSKNGLNLDDKYEYNGDEDWEFKNTPLKIALLTYHNRFEDYFGNFTLSTNDRIYFDQIFLFLVDKITPDNITIEQCATIASETSSVIFEEFLKRYEGEKSSFYLNESTEYTDFLLGFDLVDTKNTKNMAFYGINFDLLPIEFLIVCYCLYNEGWNSEDDTKNKIKILKYNSPHPCFERIQSAIDKDNKKSKEKLVDLWNFYISL